jgi:hypothetical protein
MEFFSLDLSSISILFICSFPLILMLMDFLMNFLKPAAAIPP